MPKEIHILEDSELSLVVAADGYVLQWLSYQWARMEAGYGRLAEEGLLGGVIVG